LASYYAPDIVVGEKSVMADGDEPVSIGDLIRQYRLDARLTQAALAERAGISLRAVQDLERSVGRPQRETARRLAQALALSPEARVQFDRRRGSGPAVSPNRSPPARPNQRFQWATRE
jgi:transcriptional regulator with XRE-family HTH domain